MRSLLVSRETPFRYIYIEVTGFRFYIYIDVKVPGTSIQDRRRSQSPETQTFDQVHTFDPFSSGQKQTRRY